MGPYSERDAQFKDVFNQVHAFQLTKQFEHFALEEDLYVSHLPRERNQFELTQ